MTVIEWLSTARAPAKTAVNNPDSGVFTFCGIGLALSIFAMLFGWFGVDGAAAF